MKLKNITYIFFALMITLSCLTGIVEAKDTAYAKVTFLNQDPDPAEPGEYVELRWKVEKYGNEELEDLIFELELDYPFYLDKGETAKKDVGSWTGYSSEDDYFTLYYKIRVDEEAIEDNYEIKLRSKSSNTNTWSVEEYDIRVGDRDQPEFVLGTMITSPSKLISDTEEAKLELEIVNIGEGDAKNVNIEAKFPEGFEASYTYSDKANLGTIEAGGSKTATFYIDISENLEDDTEYDAQIIVNYKDDDEYKTKYLNLDIPLKEKPDFEIIPNIQQIAPGEETELKLQITNKGSEEAESVSIKAFKESSQPFDFEEKSDFIGTLSAGEKGEAILKFTVDEDAKEKRYLLDLEIRSIDGDEVIVQDETIPLTVAEEKGGLFGTGAVTAAGSEKNISIFGLITAIVLISGIVGFASYKIGAKKSR